MTPRPLKLSKITPKGSQPGTKYNRLTILEYLGRDDKSFPFVRVRCDCGNVHDTALYEIRKGEKKSCGCYGREINQMAHEAALAPKVQAYKRLKRSWQHMKNRCYRSNRKDYPRYGGRGITVCDRWRFGENGKSGFACFYEDMGDRPEGMTIERKNTNGAYSPENCIWLPRPLQDRNRRSNSWVEVNGERMIQVVAEEVLGLAKKNLSKYIASHRKRGHEKFMCRGKVVTILPVTDQKIQEFQ